jgi:hypothetical protein
MSTNQTTAADRQFLSIGFLCQMFQRTPAELRSILAAASIPPSHSVNGISYYDGRAVETLRSALATERN